MTDSFIPVFKSPGPRICDTSSKRRFPPRLSLLRSSTLHKPSLAGRGGDDHCTSDFAADKLLAHLYFFLPPTLFKY